MEKRFTRVARASKLRGTDRNAYGRWRRATVRKLKEITGYDTMQRCPLKPRITETVACEGYRRQRVEIQTEPGIVMPFYVCVPDSLKRGERRPPIVCCHGHGSGGKLLTAGIGDDPLVADAIREYRLDIGHKLAQRGAVTFCPDARGFGERQEPSIHLLERQPITAKSCLEINQMAYPLGQTVTGMWAWDLTRLIDYIQTRGDCDSKRLGCAGLSGGGLQTMWLSAFDQRVRFAAISGYFYGYCESLLQMHRNCSCNYVPHLYEHVDMGDIGALIAPRPLLIQSGSRDPLNGASGLKNVESQVRITRRAYRLLEASNLLKHDVFNGRHRWDDRVAIPWLCDRAGLSGKVEA